MNKPLLAAFRYTTNNWAQVQSSKVCGCCNCLQIFTPDDIVAWTGLEISNIDDPAAIDKQTAMCPHCGVEAVLADASGFPVNAQFLGSMNEAWFQRTMIKAKPKA
ncbi:MAG: hypothetical protein RLZZ618_2162 [Pseudomonadota bacterium]|jgi:hypothetical protein